MTAPTRLTLAAGLATVLGAIPLAGGFAQQSWLWYAAAAVAAVAGVGVLARHFHVPAAAIPVLQVLGLLIYYTVVFAGGSSFLGVVPGPGTFEDLNAMITAAMHDIQFLAAPVPTRTELIVLAALSVGLVGILIDILAVTLRRPAVAGLALLALFAVATSVGGGVLWAEFLLAALGFLLLLAVEGRERLVRWGRLVVDDDRDPDTGTRPISVRVPRHSSAGRIGVVALAAALVVPPFVPGFTSNVLSHIGRGPGSGSGSGATGAQIDPFTSLQGELSQDATFKLLKVAANVDQPYYLRTTTLDRYTPAGWRLGPGDRDSVGLGPNLPLPDPVASLRDVGQSRQVSARITVQRYTDNYLPVYYAPTSVRGLGDAWRYENDRADIHADNGTTRPGLSYTVTAIEPRPTKAHLEQAKQLPPDSPVQLQWGAAPNVRPEVGRITAEVIAGARTPFDRAVALYRYFTDGTHGFVYSLQTKRGPTSDQLLNFLTNKQGFCEQYASAMAVMLRLAGVPSRVVLGYTAGTHNVDGSWTITNHDAHAWVEAYLDQVGWVSFDPTPLSDGRSQTGPYLPTPPNQIPLGGTRRGTSGATPAPRSTPHAPAGALSGTHTPGSGGGSSAGGIAPATLGLWLAVAVLVGLLAVPAVTRRVQRRRRLRIGAGPDPAAAAGSAWDEVVSDAEDYGIELSAMHSPRTAVTMLTADRRLPEPAVAGLRLVALAEERSRYARTAGVDGDLPGAVAAIRRGFAAGAGWPRRIRAVVAPPSTLQTAGRAVQSTARGVEQGRRNLGDLPKRIVPRRLRGAQR